jgi:hypothetical protein
MECSLLKNWNVSSVAVVVQIQRVDPLLLAKEMTRRVPIVVAVDSTGLIATAMESSTRKNWKVCRRTSGAVSIAMGMASSRRKSWKASVVAVAMIVAAEAEVAVAAARRSDRSRVVVRAISPVVAEVVEVAEIHRRRPLLLLRRSQPRSRNRPRSRYRCNDQLIRGIKTPRPETPDAASSCS